MSYAPCKNPNCKSYGKPHPNCRCYGGMAEGGEVSFCGGKHKKGCQYYQDGGEVVGQENVDIDDSPSELPSPDDIQIDVPAGNVEVDATSDESQEIPDVSVQVDAEDIVPDADVSSDEEKYTTPGQQVIAGLEGAAKGVGSFVAPLAEVKLGVPAEDISARQKYNPGISKTAEYGALIGSAVLSEGALPAITKLAEAASMGSSALKGAIATGLLQGGDEVSKWILGQQDPDHPVAASLINTGAAGLFGLVGGYASGKIGDIAKSKLQELAASKFGYKAESFLAGIAFSSGASKDAIGEGVAFTGQAHPIDFLDAEYDKKAFDAGARFFNETTKKVINTVMGSAGAVGGGHSGGIAGSVQGTLAGLLLGHYAGKGVSKASEKVIAPTILKVLQSDTTGGIFDALNHAANIEKGAQCLARGIDNIFSVGSIGASKVFDLYRDELKNEKLDEYIGNGGINQDVQDQIYQDHTEPKPLGYAKGGEVSNKYVSPDPIGANSGVAKHFPEQNLLMNMAKGRVSNYLSSLKPQPAQPMLTFDDKPDTRSQEKTYKTALSIANYPLGVLNEIKKGTIEQDHVKHLSQMYPEVHGLMQKKLTEKVTKMQLKGEKPPYKIRQGLSLFMGAPLSSEMLPGNIVAAQAVFAKPSNKQQPAQQASSGGKNMSVLTKSDNAFLTNSQARTERRQKV